MKSRYSNGIVKSIRPGFWTPKVDLVSHRNISDPYILREFTEENGNVYQMMVILFEKRENMEGKGVNVS